MYLLRIATTAFSKAAARSVIIMTFVSVVVLVSSFQVRHQVKSNDATQKPSFAVSKKVLEREETTLSCPQVTVVNGRRDFLTHSFISALGIATLSYCDNTNKDEIANADGVILLDSSSTSKKENDEDTDAKKLKLEDILDKATKRAISGGRAGASAAVVQVLALMWLRTTMNYQYRYGGSFQEALSKLYNEGGISRLYQGLPFALVQGPLTRFGDTAANVGMLALLSEYSSVPIIVKTAAGSIAAGMWRIVLMPIDTSKTAMQVEGAQGLQNLAALVVDKKSPSPLYQGAIAAAAATAVGHFPWFLTFNFLNNAIPSVDASEHLLQSLLRSAFLGVCSSCVSDTCSNSLRVIKTTKQTAALSSSSSNNNKTIEGEITNTNDFSYKDAVGLVLEKDGWSGLLGRGLRTRLLTNALQGAMFSVLWKYFQSIGGS